MEMYKLPDIIELNHFGGDFNMYFEHLYSIFKNHFIDDKPVFRGVRLGLKRHPELDGKAYTFYHMTHDGDIENERLPDMRRLERIHWPRPMIDDSTDKYLKVWRNVRRGKGGIKNRILILHEKERYLVVLEDRGDYILPWTAYYLSSSKSLGKNIKEYNNFINAENAKLP